jgi:hypothetical protein
MDAATLAWADLINLVYNRIPEEGDKVNYGQINEYWLTGRTALHLQEDWDEIMSVYSSLFDIFKDDDELLDG